MEMRPTFPKPNTIQNCATSQPDGTLVSTRDNRHLIVSFPSIFTELCFLQKKQLHIFCFAMQFMTSIDGQASGIPMRGQDQDINFVFS